MWFTALDDYLYMLYEVCWISCPLNHVRKLLCNLQTLKPRRINIAVLPHILNAFIPLQHSLSLQI